MFSKQGNYLFIYFISLLIAMCLGESSEAGMSRDLLRKDRWRKTGGSPESELDDATGMAAIVGLLGFLR